MATSVDALKNVLDKFVSCTGKPEQFLELQESLAADLRTTVKSLYDFTKSADDAEVGDSLPELIVDGFDDEQIWQQLELQNGPSVQDLVTQVAHVATCKNINFKTDSSKSKKTKINNVKIKSVRDIKSSSDTSESDLEEEESDDEQNNTENVQGEIGIPLFAEEDGSEESEEEKELKNLLDKVQSKDKIQEESDDELSDTDFDFETGSQKKEKKSKDKEETDEEESEDEQKERSQKSVKSVQKRKTVVDDAFFKLSDMEAFLEMEDAKEEKKIRRENAGRDDEESSDDDSSDGEEEEDVDFFDDIPSDNEEGKSSRDMKYSGFFAGPESENDEQTEKGSKKKRVKFQLKENSKTESGDDEDSGDAESGDEAGEGSAGRKSLDLLADSESEGEDLQDIFGGRKEEKSSYEKRQERLKSRIDDLEKKSLDEKAWQLKGEVAAGGRPENSLLQEDLDFEHTTRQAPIITEETTKTLEELIQQRIKDQAWDDVERKTKPVDAPHEYKKKVVLDQEKSKMSLSQIYEQEYIKQQQNEEKEEADPGHEAIKKMMTSLFTKLDALSNFHYTPKPGVSEVKIVSNLPSIGMEDVAPVSVSDAAQLAPHEIEEKIKGEVKGKTERSETDRKRERRVRKKLLRKRQKAREEKNKLKQGKETTQSKEKAMKDLEKQSKSAKSGVTIVKDDKHQKRKNLTSSTQFFTQLQEEVTSQISSKKAERKKKEKNKNKSVSKYKL